MCLGNEAAAMACLKAKAAILREMENLNCLADVVEVNGNQRQQRLSPRDKIWPSATTSFAITCISENTRHVIGTCQQLVNFNPNGLH